MESQRSFSAIVLHAHLPYVRHPEHRRFHEELWLFEAISETYLPLISMLERLAEDGMRHCLTLSLSPTLLTMLDDPLLKARYQAHLQRLGALVREETRRLRKDAGFGPVARFYRQRIEAIRKQWEAHNGDLISAFSALRAQGVVELITSAATHAYLPLLRSDPASIRAQLQLGAQTFRRFFGVPAEGVWLPECGYFPGLEDEVGRAGFRYFFVDSHGIEQAAPRPRYGVTAPLVCENGVAVFGRDPLSSRLVWSREEGYPGDPLYRDFYRDIGFERPLDALRPFLPDSQSRIHTGLKYHRITGPGDDKLPYQPEIAARRAALHAEDFLARIAHAAREGKARGGGPPSIRASLYDAELFGHWWFEGPLWLEAVIRRQMLERKEPALVTPSVYLQGIRRLQCATPAASSWGDGGYNAFWLNPDTDWMYPLLHQAGRQMQTLAKRFGEEKPDSLAGRALRQAGRSLLLAQASDWAFLQRTGTAGSYADRQVRSHLQRFDYLRACLEDQALDERRLQALEAMDHIFPEFDPAIFAEQSLA